MPSVTITSALRSLPAAVADGHEVIAIGDVHGCRDQLAALIEEAGTWPRERPHRVLVLLGDLIDRGPHSLGSVDLARQAAEHLDADETIALCGNHEQMLRIALDRSLSPFERQDALQLWLSNGGHTVLREVADEAGRSLSRDEAQAALQRRLGDWLGGLATQYRSGDLFFVHAGLPPDLDPDACFAISWQELPATEWEAERHWAWVREPFLLHRPGRGGHHGRFVVHGHSMMPIVDRSDEATQIARWRLNLDGGSYHTGCVRMALLAGSTARICEARALRRS